MRDVLRLSAVLLLLHPLKALGVIVPVIAGLAMMLLVPFLALFAPAVIAWLSSYTLEQVFRLHMRPEELARVEEDLNEQ